MTIPLSDEAGRQAQMLNVGMGNMFVIVDLVFFDCGVIQGPHINLS